MPEDSIPRIYHRGGARSLRVIHLMEEMGENYEVFMLKPDTEQPLEAQLRAAGVKNGRKMPTLAHGDFHVFESAAIASYLTGLYGKLDGDTMEERALVMQWLAFSDTMITTGGAGIIMNVDEKGGLPGLAKTVLEKFGQQIQTIENEFTDHPSQEFLLPSGISAADCAVAYTLHMINTNYFKGLEGFPKTKAYFERVTSRPAYKTSRKYAEADLVGKGVVSKL